MPGRWYERLFQLAANRYGYVTTEDAKQIGAMTQVLVDMHRHGQLDRVGHGIYRFSSFPSGPHDELMEATLWPRGLGVISHDSALDLWDLCDVNPARIHVTVPATARVRRRVPEQYAVHLRDLDPDDITVVEGIPTVTAVRAVLDGIDRHLDGRLIDQAIDNGQRRGVLLNAEVRLLERAR